jgi:hypothetical protein
MLSSMALFTARKGTVDMISLLDKIMQHFEKRNREPDMTFFLTLSEKILTHLFAEKKNTLSSYMRK